MTSEFKCGDLILKLESDKPSESLRRKAFIELRETEENIENGLKELKCLLEAEKDLIAPVTNDEWLMMFLRTCKFYPESARDLIKRFLGIRQKYSEIHTMIVPSKLKHVFDANLVSILPQRDQHGRRVIVSLSGKQWNPKIISIDELFSCSVLCSDILQKEPASQINGVVYILDLKDFSLGQFFQYTPYVVKRFLDFTQNNAPLRVKGVHVVNQPKIFQPIFAAIKPFFSTKTAERIIMHGSNFESLHRYISPECLPKCYGGTLKSDLMYSRETYELLAYHEKFFEDLQKFGLQMFQG